MQTRATQAAAALQASLNAPGHDLAPAALALARVEYPALEPAPWLAELDRLAALAARRIATCGIDTDATIRAFNEFLYDECGFHGNRDRYDDPRNSFLNEVLDRRTGLPITLAVVYMEVARRAGLRVDGVNFPGHFLLRVPLPEPGDEDAVIVDPFHGGAILSEYDCRQLLRQHVGDEAAFDPALLHPATRRDIVVRMLVNLKRLYVRMRSFPQARFVSTLLLAAEPAGVSELRDRGLLAYHLQDFPAALRDLEEYLRLSPRGTADVSAEIAEATGGNAPEDETSEIWEHVKTLRRRVAGFN